MDSNRFNYTEYIQKRLKEIDDLDERKFAKEVLIENLGHIFSWTEEKYDALQQRIQNEFALPWENYSVYTAVVDKTDYDPTGTFWFPLCQEDGRVGKSQGNPIIYLMADDEMLQEFMCRESVIGVERESGREICFKIEAAEKYQERIRKLYQLFLDNHIPWRTVHMGHIERFFQLVPSEDIQPGDHILFQWGRWEVYVKTGIIPLWNVQKTALSSREFRYPCINGAVYEHIFYLEEGDSIRDGYLAETEEAILSIRYEVGRFLLKTESETLDNVCVYRLHQKEEADVYDYRHPVLTNRTKNSFAVRYLNQMGNFIQTPMELYRKMEEMSGNYNIRVVNCEIIDSTAENMVSGDMNDFIDAKIFSNDNRKVLLFQIQKDIEQEDYLYGAQVRYMLSQMQMEFLEYRCMGVFV